MALYIILTKQLLYALLKQYSHSLRPHSFVHLKQFYRRVLKSIYTLTIDIFNNSLFNLKPITRILKH